MNVSSRATATAAYMHAPVLLTVADQITLDCCPVCSSSDFVPFRHTDFRGTVVHHQRCRICSHVFMNPRPTQDWYDRLFAEEYWEGRAIKWETDAHQNAVQWHKQLQRSEHYIAFLSEAGQALPSGARILEIGCAYGLIVKMLAEHFRGVALGVEPSRVAREFARDVIGVDIVAEAFSDIDQWQPQDPVDMILFSHVMEYIADLDHVFRTIHRLVKPGGLVLMETPNIFFRHATHIYHPHCFSKRSLRALFSRYGMDIVALTPLGRIKTLLSPDNYLTLAASLTSSTSPVALSQQRTESRYAGALMKLGQGWFRLSNRFPVHLLLGALAGNTKRLSPRSEQQLAELMAGDNEALRPTASSHADR